MAKWTSYFKFVTPSPDTLKVADNQDLSGGNLYGNYSWYQRLVHGSSSRLTRYKEYDLMDNDVEVNRALDTIAEEMTGNEITPGAQVLNIVTEKDTPQTLPTTTVDTLRAALKHWSNIHHFETKLFSISRSLIKYGDCFLKRQDDFKKWNYLHPKNVIAAVVDKEDITNVVGFQIRTNDKKPKAAVGGSVMGQEYDTEVLDADKFVRFTLNDDMSDMAPFGDSVLKPVYRAHKQKELLEDSIIIYRVQRAPERRVFYIDVGKMPPQRVKTYLEQIKNEIRQRKIPSLQGGKSQIDSVYNPQSMSEDFFFAQRPDGRGSRVDTLPGGQGLGELADLEYFQDKVFRGLRVPVSYMKKGAEGAIWNDGKVGTAYIQELRFALFVRRLQMAVERVIDYEFKRFLRAANIHIDETLYKVRLPEPQNFGVYRQQELDSALLNSFSTADGVTYLSRRFILSRFLKLSDEDIAENEKQLREEKGLTKDPNYAELPILYGPPPEEGGMLAGPGGGGGGGLGLEPGAMIAGGQEVGGEEGAGGEAGGAGGGEETPTV